MFQNVHLPQGHPRCMALGVLLQLPTERLVPKEDLVARIYLMQEHLGFHPENSK